MKKLGHGNDIAMCYLAGIITGCIGNRFETHGEIDSIPDFILCILLLIMTIYFVLEDR